VCQSERNDTCRDDPGEYQYAMAFGANVICVAPSVLDALLEQAQVEYVNGLYRGVPPLTLDIVDYPLEGEYI